MLGRKIDEITYQATRSGRRLAHADPVHRLDRARRGRVGAGLHDDGHRGARASARRAAGGSVPEPIRRIDEFGLRVVFVLDPEGHVNEVVQTGRPIAQQRTTAVIHQSARRSRFRPCRPAPDHREGLQRRPAPPPARGRASPRSLAADPRRRISRRPRRSSQPRRATLPEGVDAHLGHVPHPGVPGYLARQGVCLYPELEDCYYNSRFLELVRATGARVTRSPRRCCSTSRGHAPIGGPPHLDGTRSAA